MINIECFSPLKEIEDKIHLFDKITASEYFNYEKYTRHKRWPYIVTEEGVSGDEIYCVLILKDDLGYYYLITSDSECYTSEEQKDYIFIHNLKGISVQWGVSYSLAVARLLSKGLKYEVACKNCFIDLKNPTMRGRHDNSMRCKPWQNIY